MKERYLLVRELGRGSFGVVSLAWDQANGRQVAIKQLVRPTPDARERFFREARTLYRQINNHFVVDLLDHDLDADPPYIVLEYCEHGSLRRWVIERRPWQEVALVLAQAVQGLQSIHEAGGFHRDLKPDNLLLATGPEPNTVVVKVADFGLARVPETISATMTGQLGGTDGYIAPEILAGSAFHPGADIYSLGIVATELLTGARDPAGLHRVQIPPRLRELVLAMCAVDSTKRPANRQVAAIVEEVLTPPALPPRPSPTSSPASGPSGGTALGGLLLFGAALLGLAALAGGDAKWDRNVRRYRGSDGRFTQG